MPVAGRLQNLRRLAAFCTLTAVSACVIAFEGEADFEATHDLEGVETVQLHLPPTDIEVVGHADSEELSYTGSWTAIGGTNADAAKNAESPSLLFERTETVARVRADIPFHVEELVELEMGRINIDDGRDLEILGDGDVHVNDVLGHVMVDVSTGSVGVFGADGARVTTGDGDLELRVTDHIDAVTERGTVTLTQAGVQKDVYATARNGDVFLELYSDGNADFVIAAGGTIDIETEQVSTSTYSSYVRTLGSGDVRIHIEATGDVSIKLIEPVEPDETEADTGSE